MTRKILLTAIVCLLSLPAKLCAQGVDATLAAMILAYTDKAEKQYKSQKEIMLLETTGHIWIQSEVSGTTDLHREFNDYLDSFRSIICYAAQIYGFYHEIDKLVDNLSDFSAQFKKTPSNSLAVALSSKRRSARRDACQSKNKIYRELIMNSVEIVNDIKTVCLSDNKMTEKERIEVVFAIRPKLKLMNKKLQRLTKAVKYTSMSDVWNEIEGGAKPKAVDKAGITRECMQRWKRSGKAGR